MQDKLVIPIGPRLNMRVIRNLVDGDVAVVIVHGLTSYVHEALYEDARRYFNRRGMSVFRPELYGWEDDARDIADCTLKTHGADLDRLVIYLRGVGYRTIYMIGHSYGWPSIQSMGQACEGVVAWDGTYVGMPLSFIKYLRHSEEDDLYTDQHGNGLVLGGDMVREALELHLDPTQLGSHLAPTKLIYAGAGIIHIHRAAQLNQLRNSGIRCRSNIIKAADHNFTDDNSKDKLFKSTYNWFRK